MSLRRQLLLSFGLQGAGAASVLLATLALGASVGPELQGAFSRTKSEIEFVAAFAMFGLPQALFFHVKSGALSGRAALRWALCSALLALPIGALYTLAQHGTVGALPLLLGAAVAACVAHGQMRALLLVREPGGWFNVLTALPQVLVLAGVLALIAWGSSGGRDSAAASFTSQYLLLFGAAYAAAALLAWRRLLNTDAAQQRSTAGWRELGHYALAAWLTAALSTAAILAVQRRVETGVGSAALGQFTLAMTLVQVPLTPISYAAPLLFRRWMERPGARASQRWAAGLFTLLIGLAALVWGLAPQWPELGLGPAYAGATRALALLMAGGAAEAASRVMTVQASATGLPWVAVRAEAVRWGVLLLGWASPLPPGLLPLCALWAAAAGAAAAVFAWQGRAASAAAEAAR